MVVEYEIKVGDVVSVAPPVTQGSLSCQLAYTHGLWLINVKPRTQIWGCCIQSLLGAFDKSLVRMPSVSAVHLMPCLKTDSYRLIQLTLPQL